MLLWLTAAVGLLLAAAAWLRAGRTARKLEALNQSYWELRYDFTRLRSHVARLDPESEQDPSTALGAGPPAPPPPDQVAFVPLSSIRKKE